MFFILAEYIFMQNISRILRVLTFALSELGLVTIFSYPPERLSHFDERAAPVEPAAGIWTISGCVLTGCA